MKRSRNPHCIYCGTEVKDPEVAPRVARKIHIGTKRHPERGLEQVYGIGTFVPVHDVCVQWLMRRDDFGGMMERRT